METNPQKIWKIFLISFRHLWAVELAYKYIFFFKFILSCQQFDNCSHCLPPVSFTPLANLPPVSLIPVPICHRRHWQRWQICIVDTPCPFNILYCTICVNVQYYTIHIVIIICNKISVEIVRHECRERTTIIWRIYANIYGVIKKTWAGVVLWHKQHIVCPNYTGKGTFYYFGIRTMVVALPEYFSAALNLLNLLENGLGRSKPATRLMQAH